MNSWGNTVITEQGLALQAKLIEGTTLKITRAVTGTGFVTPGLLVKQTEVTNPQQTMEFRPVSYPETGKCALTVVLDNEGLTEGYSATQVGVFAKDPDEGEILYFISQAPGKDHGTEIPADSETSYSAEWTFYIQYGQADEVTVVVDPAGAVSREEMKEYIGEEFAPLTQAEIDAAAGFAGGGDSSGDTTTGETTGVGTLDHSLLYNRNVADQHTIESITGLEEALTAAEGETIATTDVESAWNDALEEIE